MTGTYYIILAILICFVYWASISSIDMLESKKRLKAKNKTWRKLNEISEKNKIEKGFKVWESLGNSNKKK